jgi:hypothetical protein
MFRHWFQELTCSSAVISSRYTLQTNDYLGGLYIGEGSD